MAIWKGYMLVLLYLIVILYECRSSIVEEIIETAEANDTPNTCSSHKGCVNFKNQCWCRVQSGQLQRTPCGYGTDYQGTYYSIKDTGDPRGLIKAMGMTPHSSHCGSNSNCKGDCATNQCYGGNRCFGTSLTCWDDKKRWARRHEGIVRCTVYEGSNALPVVDNGACSSHKGCVTFENQCWCRVLSGQLQRTPCGYGTDYQGTYYSIKDTGDPRGLIKAMGMTPHSSHCGSNSDCKGDCATNQCYGGNRCFGTSLTCWDNKKRWARRHEGIVRCTVYEGSNALPVTSTVVNNGCSSHKGCVTFENQCWCRVQSGQLQRTPCGYGTDYQGTYYSIKDTGDPRGLIKAMGMTPHSSHCGSNSDCKGDCATNQCYGGNRCFGTSLTCWDDKRRWARRHEGIVRCTVYENVIIPVHGGWGQWSGFGSCSKTCGPGERTRTRQCNDPSPKFGGKTCVGNSNDKKSCKLKECLGSTTCSGNSGNGYEAVGCFKRSKHHLKELLITDLDPYHEKWGNHIDWEKFQTSVQSLACRCNAKARSKGMMLFSISFYGECYGGNLHAGAELSTECVSGEYATEQCSHHNKHACAGIEDTEYVYKIL